MENCHNKTGKPLSSLKWLNAHHIAKYDYRKLFAERIAKLKPKSLVDMGCGYGLWLDVFNNYIDSKCDFIGLDIDKESINISKEKSKTWTRKTSFIECNIEKDIDSIPSADVYFLSNMFSYLINPSEFIERLKQKFNSNSVIIVRQFDGSLLRFGPMSQKIRSLIDSSLYTSVGKSKEFNYYDMDRAFEVLNSSSLKNKDITFELFQESTPFSDNFIEYFSNTIDWTIEHISENAAVELKKWQERYIKNLNNHSYFIGVDLIGFLS